MHKVFILSPEISFLILILQKYFFYKIVATYTYKIKSLKFTAYLKIIISL